MKKKLTLNQKCEGWNKVKRLHFLAYNRKVDEWNILIKNSCYLQMIPSFEPGVEIIIESYSKRPLDPDNLVAKFCIDGLKHAKVIGDDTLQWVASVTTKSIKAKEEKTIIIIKGK